MREHKNLGWAKWQLFGAEVLGISALRKGQIGAGWMICEGEEGCTLPCERGRVKWDKVEVS
jgi:hypothetical protein